MGRGDCTQHCGGVLEGVERVSDSREMLLMHEHRAERGGGAYAGSGVEKESRLTKTWRRLFRDLGALKRRNEGW